LLKKGRDPSPPASLVDFAIDDNDEPTLLVARSRLPAGTLDLRAGDQLVALGSAPQSPPHESPVVGDAARLRAGRGAHRRAARALDLGCAVRRGGPAVPRPDRRHPVADGAPRRFWLLGRGAGRAGIRSVAL